jgi:hypothetical protein
VFLKWGGTTNAHGEGAEGWLYSTAVRVSPTSCAAQTLRAQYERLLGQVKTFLIDIFSAFPAADITGYPAMTPRIEVTIGGVT